MRSLISIGAITLFTACDTDDPPARLFPDDWATSFVKVRECRSSSDHDLEQVALWLDPASQERWNECVDAFPEGGSTCTDPFPEGATFLKVQYLDAACTQVSRFSVAKKAKGFDATGGWHWQEVLLERGEMRVSQDGKLTRCSSCHAACVGFDQRCYMEP